MNPENQQNDFSGPFRRPSGITNQQSRFCDEIEAAIPAHGLGATDPEEAANINARLAHCPQAADELAAFSALATRMLYGAPPVEAPQHIADRLRAAIATSTPQPTRTTNQLRPAFLRRTPSPRLPGQAHNRPLVLPPAMADFRLEGTDGSVPVAATLPAKPSKPSSEVSNKQGRSTSQYFGWVLATAAAVALLVANVALIVQNQRLVEQSQALAAQNQQMLAHQEVLSHSLAQQNQALILLAAEEPQEIEIFDPSGESTAKADILWNNSLGIAVVYVRDFPQCESGMKYQLWLTKNGERYSGGLFSVDTSGMGLLVVPLEDALDTYDVIGITSEPATGSPGPTSPPIVRGEL